MEVLQILQNTSVVIVFLMVYMGFATWFYFSSCSEGNRNIYHCRAGQHTWDVPNQWGEPRDAVDALKFAPKAYTDYVEKVTVNDEVRLFALYEEQQENKVMDWLRFFLFCGLPRLEYDVTLETRTVEQHAGKVFRALSAQSKGPLKGAYDRSVRDVKKVLLEARDHAKSESRKLDVQLLQKDLATLANFLGMYATIELPDPAEKRAVASIPVPGCKPKETNRKLKTRWDLVDFVTDVCDWQLPRHTNGKLSVEFRSKDPLDSESDSAPSRQSSSVRSGGHTTIVQEVSTRQIWTISLIVTGIVSALLTVVGTIVYCTFLKSKHEQRPSVADMV